MVRQTLTLTKHSGKPFDLKLYEGQTTTKKQVRLGYSARGNEWYEIKFEKTYKDAEDNSITFESKFCYSVKGRYASKKWFQLAWTKPNKVSKKPKKQVKANHLTI